jgi:hypothetical protein
MKQNFQTTKKPVSPVEAKEFIENLFSDPDISLGDECMYGDPYGEFVYNFIENQFSPEKADSVTDGFMEELDVDGSGKVTGKYSLSFDDGSEMGLEFSGFVTEDSGDGGYVKTIVITQIEW